MKQGPKEFLMHKIRKYGRSERDWVCLTNVTVSASATKDYGYREESDNLEGGYPKEAVRKLSEDKLSFSEYEVFSDCTVCLLRKGDTLDMTVLAPFAKSELFGKCTCAGQKILTRAAEELGLKPGTIVFSLAVVTLSWENALPGAVQADDQVSSSKQT
jgi:hypothetical protein